MKYAMTRQEMIETLRNVASDLASIADSIEDSDTPTSMTHELWKDAKLYCEYVTTNTPH